MRRQLEGSRAIAEAVARCRPQVVPAYPITPQTHIVEAIGAMVRDGSLSGCEVLTVESEFAAVSAGRRRRVRKCRRAGIHHVPPFPYAEVRKALGAAKRVVVVERAFAPGAGGVVSADVRAALGGTFEEVSTVVAGLGGRAVTKAGLRRLVADAMSGWLGERLVFLDLRDDLIEQQIHRMRQRRASGPHALGVLRDADVPGSRLG